MRRRWPDALLTFAVCLGLAGAGSAVAADVTSSTSIARGGLVLNRVTNTFDSTVTITNTGQASLPDPVKLIVTIDQPQVTLANKTGTTIDGKPFVQLPLTTGSLNQGQAVSTSLKFSNPSRVQFTATFQVDAQTAQSGGLPPDPGEAGKVTVAGVDSNGNGVRDDIERYIALTYPNSEKTRRALTDFAIGMQAALLSDRDIAKVNAATTIESKALDCVEYIEETLPPRRGLWESLRAEILNTKLRSLAYYTYNKLLAGASYSLPDSLNTDCTFDPGSLPD